jgi:hypothetical protein
MEWEGEETTPEEVSAGLHKGGGLPCGLELALELSGFEWWAAIRETEGS